MTDEQPTYANLKQLAQFGEWANFHPDIPEPVISGQAPNIVVRLEANGATIELSFDNSASVERFVAAYSEAYYACGSYEEMEPLAFYRLIVNDGHHASCSTIESLADVIRRHVGLDEDFAVSVIQGDHEAGRGEYERMEDGRLLVHNEAGAAVGLYDQLIWACVAAEEEQEELARQAEYELRLTQTFPSQFSSLEAYEEWREAND